MPNISGKFINRLILASIMLKRFLKLKNKILCQLLSKNQSISKEKIILMN